MNIKYLLHIWTNFQLNLKFVQMYNNRLIHRDLSETMKEGTNKGKEEYLYFYRDKTQREE